VREALARLQAGIDAPVGGAPVVVEAPVVVRESPAARLARLQAGIDAPIGDRGAISAVIQTPTVQTPAVQTPAVVETPVREVLARTFPTSSMDSTAPATSGQAEPCPSTSEVTGSSHRAQQERQDRTLRTDNNSQRLQHAAPRRRSDSPIKARRARSPSPRRGGDHGISRDDFATMFMVLGQMTDSGQLAETVVETIEGLIASKSPAISKAFATYKESKDSDAFAASLKQVAAAEVENSVV